MKATLKSLLNDILTPSATSETPYQFLLIALGHILVGAALVEIGLPALLVIVGYVLLKELPDLRRGGFWRDGLIDTGFVTAGVAMASFAQWAALALLLALGATIARGYWQGRGS